MPARTRVRHGDGTPCRFAANVLEELGALVVYAGQAGRGYGDVQSLERRALEADEKATSIRADLQRMLRDGQSALVAGAQLSAWPEVREHARKAGSELQGIVEQWQAQASTNAEHTRKNLGQYQQDITESMRADLHDYLRYCAHANVADVTVVRRLGTERYVDTLRFEAAAALRVELDVVPGYCTPAKRVRSWMKKAVVQAGTRKGLFGGEKPRELKLDPYYIVEAVLSPGAIDLRLSPKLTASNDVLLLRLRPEGGRIVGHCTLGESQREPAVGDATLQQLWDALQQERLQTAQRHAVVSTVELDGNPVPGARGYFGCAERLIDKWRPIVSELARHTPGSDELCVLVGNDGGNDDELWVRTADLTQHLLTIPTAIRPRLSPLELLGPARVTRESDIIDLGKVMTPDAGDDSDVISLHYIPPSQAGDVVEAGAPSPVLELASGDTSVLELGRDPREDSGCYDLSKLERSAQSG